MTSTDTATTRWRRRATCALASTAMIAGGAVALASPALAATTTVYVSTSGNDHSGCGTTLANQCATIQYGVDQAGAGDTVQVAAGQYFGNVSITKALTLTGAGASSTTIDGLGVDSPSNGLGLVSVVQPGGDVTVSGFTIQNPTLGTGYSPYSLTASDSNSDDTLTITANTFPGDPGDALSASQGPLGVDSSNTAATQLITDNDFSGLWQAALIEGSSGPVTVSGNTFHDLIGTSDGGTGSYPAEGVYFLSDKEVVAQDQNITDNSFTNYGGIGIAFSAGYDLGGCANTVCDGTVSGSITGNTFALGANTPNDYPAAALRLRALNAGDALNLTIGGNTGTVVAPTVPVIEDPRSGSITITPGDTANTIVTDPAPTVSVGAPSALTTDEPATEFTGTATNPSGDDLTNARYDVTITGTSGLTASQLKLEYSTDDGATYQTVPLSGTAQAGDAITGYFGPATGFTFPGTPDGSPTSTLTTKFRVSVPDVTAPSGVLATKVSLDQVSSGTGNPVINTLASSTSSTTVTMNTAPVASNIDVSTVVNTPVDITLPGSDANGDALTFTHFSVNHGTLTGSGQNLTFTPDTGYVGTTSFAYSVTDNKAGSDSGTVTITVAPKAVSTLALTVSPVSPTTATPVTVNATVTTPNGPASGGSVTVAVNSQSYTADLVNGAASIPVGTLPAGTYAIAASYSGTGTTTSSTASGSVTVAKVASSLTVTRTPATTTTATASTALNVTVASPGISPDGGQVTITEGTRTVGTSATVTGGVATVTLPRLGAGTRTFTVTYAGTATVAGSSTNVTITIAKVASTLTVTRSPASTTTKTASTALNVTVASPGISPDGGKVTITEGTRTVGTSATVVGGKAKVTLPKLGAGTRTFTVHYAGTASVAGSSVTVTIKVTTA